MKKAKKWSIKFLSFLMTLIMLAASLNLPALATIYPDELPEDLSFDQNQFENVDSEFVLANPDQYMPEDYNPEKIDEEEKANAALELLREEMPITELNALSGEVSGMMAASNIVELGDPYVFRVQKWLNQTYGGVSGFGSVPENGKTGWDTIYGLTRALQIELGITGLVNNFGPTTRSRYSADILKYGSTGRKVSILIGALLCKGYDPGGPSIPTYDANDKVVFSTTYETGIEYAVKKLKEHAGFLSPSGDVTANVMKALLSMDTFVLLSSYGGKAEVRAMQQKFNRTYEAYFETDTSIGGLIPCDGVFGRSTNKALIYALQAIEGLPVGTATGSFGTTTKSLCPTIPYIRDTSAAKTYQGAYYTDTQITSLIELVQFSLFLNGFTGVPISGNFNTATKENLLNFQSSQALPKSGKADIDTWMSLFLSSGNPDRSALAADCAQPLTPATVTTLYNNGYRYIGRYLTGTYSGGLSKALTVSEANNIIAGGLRFFPIYQSGQYVPSADADLAKTYFTPTQATYDANAAISAAQALGIPKGTIIYFAVDFDFQDTHITSNILPYFQTVSETMFASGYKTGIYGTRNVCSRVAAKGYSCSSFVAGMSTGWSGNLGFKMPDNWAFSQIKEYTIGAGAGSVGIDKNAFSGRDQGVAKLNAVKKRAVYVLPGFMGSKLYTPDGTQFFIEGTDMDISLANPKNIPLLTDIAKNSILRKSSVGMLNSDGSGSKLHVDAAKDKTGSLYTFAPLITELTNQLGNIYQIEYFPYNWLGDLNDSVKVLEQDIKNKEYTEVIFVTHSTGGLLASTYIARYNKDTNIHKPKVTKAILVAAPLFGTYASLAPIETGVGSFLGDKYDLVDGIVQTIKYGGILPVQLGPITNIYDAATNWVKDVTHNSPTTYQLLPSVEYLKLMPQLKANEEDFEGGFFTEVRPITTTSEYYQMLNGSSNINSNLTNGNNRSHKYFRETVLGGDIVKTLQGVDTLLIASESGPKKTPTLAMYKSKLFGGTKLNEIVYKEGVGDGTVHYSSATANLKKNDTRIKVSPKENIGHTSLIKNSDVIQEICNEIKAVNLEKDSSVQSFATTNSLGDDAGMSNMIKINYLSNTLISASIFDNAQNEVAKISSDDYFGFDGGDFIYYSYVDEPGTSDATIYIPNSGYKIVFKYGNQAGVNVNFNAEVSTLNIDGWKEKSVTKSAAQTNTNGIITSIDGTINTISNDNISSVVSGIVTNHFTDWELSDIMKVNKNDIQSVPVTGSQASQVASLLNWSSADESIVTVTGTGMITAVGYGKTTISATDGNKSTACEVVVMQNAASVTFPDAELFIGERRVVAPTFAPVTATETAMTYTYDKGNVIKIDEDGVIHALAAGTVTVTGTTEYGVSATFVVTVIDPDFIRQKGDINGDDRVNVVDLVRLKKHFAGAITLSGDDLLAADLNRDGNINSADLIMLRKILLGII